ncbi:MAG: pilus assembly protein PilM [Methylococcaceae bacterium]|nr:pilus assembly protein PilM [Methylococcaceae bacterium]
MDKDNWMRFFRRSKPRQGEIVAVSLVHGGICIAHVQTGGPKLLQCGFYPCADERREQKLAQVVESQGLAGCACRFVLDSGDYRLLQINAPEVSAEEMREALRWRVQELIDFPAEEAEIEYFPMPSSQLPEGGVMVTAVACRRSVIQAYCELGKKAKLALEVIDIPELALRNIASQFPESENGVALLYLDENRGRVQLQKGDMVYVTRMVEFGSRELAAVLISDEKNETDGVFGRLTLEIQRSLDYYESYFDVPPASTLVVAPIAVGTPVLVSRLRQALGLRLTTRVLDTAALIPSSERLDDVSQQRCLTAIGAALRQEAKA